MCGVGGSVVEGVVCRDVPVPYEVVKTQDIPVTVETVVEKLVQVPVPVEKRVRQEVQVPFTVQRVVEVPQPQVVERTVQIQVAVGSACALCFFFLVNPLASAIAKGPVPLPEFRGTGQNKPFVSPTPNCFPLRGNKSTLGWHRHFVGEGGVEIHSQIWLF